MHNRIHHAGESVEGGGGGERRKRSRGGGAQQTAHQRHKPASATLMERESETVATLTALQPDFLKEILNRVASETLAVPVATESSPPESPPLSPVPPPKAGAVSTMVDGMGVSAAATGRVPIATSPRTLGSQSQLPMVCNGGPLTMPTVARAASKCPLPTPTLAAAADVMVMLSSQG